MLANCITLQLCVSSVEQHGGMSIAPWIIRHGRCLISIQTGPLYSMESAATYYQGFFSPLMWQTVRYVLGRSPRQRQTLHPLVEGDGRTVGLLHDHHTEPDWKAFPILCRPLRYLHVKLVHTNMLHLSGLVTQAAVIQHLRTRRDVLII